MSQLRHDPIQGRWVIIAEGPRGLDPDIVPFSDAIPTPPNPFLPGNEANTQEIWRWPFDARPWQVRVVANRFPSLAIEGELSREPEGQYDRINGIGAHEVIIHSRDEAAQLTTMPHDNAYGVMLAWRERLRDLAHDKRLRYVLIFMNRGRAAGAVHRHSHSQLIATPITPRTVAIELQSARQHYLVKERCLFCDIVRQELQDQKRLVHVDEHFVTLAPYASRFPFEMHVLPRQHAHDFRHASADLLHNLTQHLQTVLKRMSKALDDPPFNLMLHTAPNDNATHLRPNYWTTLHADWHWHIELFPRLRRSGGFEWGTGFYVNPTAPEHAAAFLAGVDI